MKKVKNLPWSLTIPEASAESIDTRQVAEQPRTSSDNPPRVPAPQRSSASDHTYCLRSSLQVVKRKLVAAEKVFIY